MFDFGSDRVSFRHNSARDEIRKGCSREKIYSANKNLKPWAHTLSALTFIAKVLIVITIFYE